jgi:hypothetical protein
MISSPFTVARPFPIPCFFVIGKNGAYLRHRRVKNPVTTKAGHGIPF